jgi:general secretion pathway protein K
MKDPANLPQRGIALLTALLVVALATISATAIFVSGQSHSHRSSRLIESETAWGYASGLETWATLLLAREKRLNETDSFIDEWAKPELLLPVENGLLRGQVRDLQGSFNLNQFANPDPSALLRARGQFQRLIEQTSRQANLRETVNGGDLADAVKDWIDPDSQPTGVGGAEDTEYFALNRRPANRQMIDVSELLAVKGMTAPLYQALLHCDKEANASPCIAAVPVDVANKVYPPLNLNTAPRLVLLSLSDKTDQSKVERFTAERRSKPLERVGDAFDAVNGFLPADVPQNSLSVNTQFFELRTRAEIGSGQVTLYSSLFRPNTGRCLVLARYLAD